MGNIFGSSDPTDSKHPLSAVCRQPPAPALSPPDGDTEEGRSSPPESPIQLAPATQRPGDGGGAAPGILQPGRWVGLLRAGFRTLQRFQVFTLTGNSQGTTNLL